jgi:NADH-quinone oxidoreductase subunit G
LQDQVILYGIKSSRYFLKKRAVEDKKLGLFIKSIMTRCIHCTRCVRFSDEIVGTKILGTLNRGQKTEIGPYTSSIFLSNISGNVIDLCPVGALTSRLYAFKARPWELKTNETIDLTDSVGSHLFVAIKELNIARVTPKKNNLLNDAFISDKARFSFDALTNLRVLESF